MCTDGAHTDAQTGDLVLNIFVNRIFENTDIESINVTSKLERNRYMISLTI